MNYSRRPDSKSLSVWGSARYLIMIVSGVVVLSPLVFMLITSVKTYDDIILHPFILTSIHLENYVTAWKLGHVQQYFLNSVFITVIVLFFQTLISILAGYTFGKLKPWGYKIFLTVIIATMFISTDMLIVPVFVLLRNLGLYNTRMGVIIPYIAWGIALSVYIIANFIESLPKELDEAAIVDGAGVFTILFKIDIPLIKPAIATTVILNFQAVWSEFFWALIMLRDESVKTLSLGLINFQSQFSSDYGVLTAGLTILTVPVILVYIFCSNYFIKGINLGAVKG